jgi:hypothetical protein
MSVSCGRRGDELKRYIVPIFSTAYTELIAEQGPKPRKVLDDGRDLVKEKRVKHLHIQ